MPLGALHGPGQYVGSGTYERMTFTTGSQGAMVDTEEQFSSAPNETTCVLDVTTAPDGVQVDAVVAGSFYCSTLVGDADATSVVTIYDGSFSANLEPVPQ